MRVLVVNGDVRLAGGCPPWAALHEARRVLRQGGIAVVAAISRWASTADGIVHGYLGDPRFAHMVEVDVAGGVHVNDDRKAGWFTTACFHRPEEIHDLKQLRQALGINRWALLSHS
ncbi:MAG: hypothetical protein ABJA34_10075 [Pseudonocardiales bacterium]